MKSLIPKLFLLAAIALLTAARVTSAASAFVAGGRASGHRSEVSGASAEVQKRAARRKTTRRATRPTASATPGSAPEQRPAKVVAKDDGATTRPSGQTQRQVVTGDGSTLGMTTEQALAVAIREALRRPGEGETRARGVLTRVECGPENAALFLVRVGDKTLKLDGGDLKGVHFMAFTPRETGSEIVCGPRKLDSAVVVTYRAEGTDGGGKLVAVEFVPANFTLEK